VATAAFLRNWISCDAVDVVERIYQRLLKRPADKDGMIIYKRKITDHRWSVRQVFEQVAGSDEYFDRFVSKTSGNLNDFIELIVTDFLARKRKPNEQALGGAQANIARSQWRSVAETLTRSEEYRTRFGDQRIPDPKYT